VTSPELGGDRAAAASARALTPAQIAPLLAAAVSGLREEVAAMSEDARVWHPAPGEWCAKEVVGHLIEAERRGFSGRIRIILGANEPRLERWDQNEVARARRDCERDSTALVDELAELRADGVRLVTGLTATDLQRAGLHPTVGRLAVGDLLHEWVHHDRNHLRQIYANLQSFAWPHMGNAQRFTTG
jgi:DinB superfamily